MNRQETKVAEEAEQGRSRKPESAKKCFSPTAFFFALSGFRD